MISESSKPMGRRGRRVSGFTLLELLVVISLIGILVALSFPSLSKSRKSTRRLQCLTRLRSLYVAHVNYLQDYQWFPPLNKEEDDGAWQYNYLIFEGNKGDFRYNFGPLIDEGSSLSDIESLFCPLQTDPYHKPGTEFNRWPALAPFDTRSGYGRRYHLSGRSLSRLSQQRGLLADVFHVPGVVRSAHQTGVNAVYTDGHGQWVNDPGDFTDNDLVKPFDALDNQMFKKLWRIVDKAGNGRANRQHNGGSQQVN